MCQEIFYKVVRIDRQTGEMSSLMVGGLAKIIYEENKWIPGKAWIDQGIFVFDSLENALNYICPSRPVRIYRCIAKEEEKGIKKYNFMSLYFGKLKALVATPFPKGTRCFKYVKLIESVSVSEIIQLFPESKIKGGFTDSFKEYIIVKSCCGE